MDINDIVHAHRPASPKFAMDHLPSSTETAAARQAIVSYSQSIQDLQSTIQQQELALSQLIAQRQQHIASLRSQAHSLSTKLTKAQAYLAPVRKLPDELLADVFLLVWWTDTKAGWTMSAVNRLWRRIALAMPKIWSSIQLKTSTASCPAEIIRLWLERSGSSTHLDIDITLTRVPGSSSAPERPISTSRRRLLHSSHHHQLPSLWSAVGGGGHPAGSPMALPSHSSLSPPHTVMSPKSDDDGSSGSAVAWGYIVFDYLVKQLPRWRHFRFMFSTPFPPLKALDEIRGHAPLLESFSVGTTDSCFPQGAEQWHWLPSSDPRTHATSAAPSLKSLELRNVPFRYSSPLLSGLTSLKLVSNNLSVQSLPLNHVMSMLASSPHLKTLELNVVTMPAVLPLSPLTLENLETAKLGCHSNQSGLLQQLMGCLNTPSLTSLSIDAECRTDMSGMSDTITSLLIRSAVPPLRKFGYRTAGASFSSSSTPYANFSGGNFPLAALQQMHHLEELNVSSCAMEPLLQALASTAQNEIDHADDETEIGGPTFGPPTTTGLGSIWNQLVQQAQQAGLQLAGPPPTSINPTPDDYLCPYLRTLTFRHCMTSHDGVTKLIRLVEARSGLKRLEFLEGGPIGGDVVSWLEGRVDKVVYTEASGGNMWSCASEVLTSACVDGAVDGFVHPTISSHPRLDLLGTTPTTPKMDDVEPIPSMSSGAVGSRFVSEKDVQEANETREKQWKEAYARIGQEPPPQPAYDFDGRSLFEKLQQQKNIKQEEWDEKMKLSNQFRGIDEEDAAFLASAQDQKHKEELAMKQKDAEEVAAFKAAVAKRAEAAAAEAKAAAAPSTTSAPIPKPPPKEKEKAKGPLGKKDQKTLLKGVIVKKKPKEKAAKSSTSEATGSKRSLDDASQPESTSCDPDVIRSRLGNSFVVSSTIPRSAKMGILSMIHDFFAFSTRPVTILSLLIYAGIFASTLWIHEFPSPAPDKGSMQLGLDLDLAFRDLQAITAYPHPYNSHHNDDVRAYILKRVKQAASQRPYVKVSNDLTSNATYGGAAGPYRIAPVVYFEGTNVLVKIEGTDDSTDDAVLLSAHYDSVSTAPGATDDGMGVATLLNLIDYYAVNRPPKDLIFNINNGEEDWLNGAHVFLEHPWSTLTKSFLNLEGAGNAGRPVLFRSSNTGVTNAFKSAEQPHGSQLFADAFKQGLIRSGTDFEVYEKAGLKGLDLAFYRQRSRYHTKYDSTAALEGKDSLWSMMQQALGATDGLLSQGPRDREGGPPVYFDLFGQAMVVISQRWMFVINIILLAAGPVAVGALILLLWKNQKLLWYNKGWLRFPVALVVSVALTIGLAFGYSIYATYAIYANAYVVFASMLSTWYIASYVVLRFLSRFKTVEGTDASRRSMIFFQIFILWWVLLLLDTIALEGLSIGGLYFITFYYASSLLAMLLVLLEMLCAREKTIHTGIGGFFQRSPGTDEDGRHNGEDRTAVIERPRSPTERTPLIPRGSDQALITESHWTTPMWGLELIVGAVFPVVLACQLTFVILTALAQTLADGNSPLTAYLLVAFFSGLILIPLMPFVHKIHKIFALFVILVLAGTLAQSYLLFPFTSISPLKVYFQQTMDLDANPYGANNTVELVAVKGFLDKYIVPSLPSGYDAEQAGLVNCGDAVDRRKGLRSCTFPGIPPNVVPYGARKQEVLTFNATRLSANSGSIAIKGVDTRSCRIYLDEKVLSVKVKGATPGMQKNYPVPGGGTKEVYLWSRTWDRTWEVELGWDGKVIDESVTGKVSCNWATMDGERIPALQEVVDFLPLWSVMSKLTDGLVEGFKKFEM